ncbi:MAG TPA: hypothetical protein VFQ77_15305 [Pseudonocardiaceae bacterium]|jgi:hypothetical protein|nr:hypothetical protein [Pseudonocardiaceae bacterium]
MSWTAFGLAVARTTGFDYQTLARLADPELPALVRSGADWAARYLLACAAARQELAALLTDPRVREGITVLAPDTLRWTVPRVRPERTGGPDKYERKLALFLQRLVAKCDTNAIAGTIGYVALDPELEPWLPDKPRRQGFVAHWVLSEFLLTRAIARLAEQQPVLGPAVALLQPAAARRITALIAGANRWADVRRGGGPIDQKMVLSLHRRGLVLSAPVLPVAEPDALQAARAAGAEDLDELATAADEYAAGGAEDKLAVLERIEGWLTTQGMAEVRRGAGEIYRDRTVLYAEHYEPETAAGWPSQRCAAVLAELQPALDLAAAVGVWGREQARARARPALAALAGDRQRVPLAEVLRALPAGYPLQIEQAAPVRALLELITDRGGPAVPEVRLSAADIGPACAGWLPIGAQPLLASPDVFISPDGNTVVLGEVHAGLTVFGNLLCFLDDRDELLARARTWLARHDPGTLRLVNVAMGQRFGKVCHLEVMPRTVELSGRAMTGRHRLSVSDLAVDRDLQVWHGEDRVELQLASGDGTVFSPFGPPAARHPTIRLPGAARMPRVSIGSCVLQRASWWFAPDEFAGIGRGSPAQRYRNMIDFADRHGLPRWVFLRIPGEPKPVHLDLANPLLVDAGVRLLSTCDTPGRAGTAGEVRITEMLPQPSADGGRMQEFRLSCVRSMTTRGPRPGRSA